MAKRNKCRECGKDLSTVHPDLRGTKCSDCRGSLVSIEPIERIIPPIHNRPANTKRRDKSLGYSTSYRNLTSKQIQVLQNKQNGKCAICDHKRFLILDHDHKTNKVRGYLCRGCNVKLAALDDPDFIGRATEYLKNPPANNL